ncbi:MAG: 1-acyl-sn-glycerol-3-phosphate acyltransferase [Chitinophagales bacterium]|nr:1-acyl-sn-glycerol-3-phosphate acyltransferase [Chitinophagales bacterium]MDW8418543.1 1-acyl-sn-glycerol-3-phosphate acyltransferase [Chitinophagales bacterium]
MGKWLGHLIFRLFGWTLDDHLKNSFRKCVMIAAPHTSNWDFIFARAAFAMMEIPVRFTVKKEWLRFPFGGMMNALGAIGIDRSPRKPGEQRLSMTEAMIRLFNGRDELVVLITPEGTRSLRTKWKTGFYHVAAGAGVPIALGYLDYKKKIAGVGKLIYPSGDMQKDMREIMQFYQNICPRYPEKFSIDTDYAS